MTFSKPHGQVFWFQTRIPGLNYALLSRDGNWNEWFNSMGIKKRNGVFRRACDGHARVDRAGSAPDSRLTLGEYGSQELGAGRAPESTTERQGWVVVKWGFGFRLPSSQSCLFPLLGQISLSVPLFPRLKKKEVI